jgi:O-antigen ligase
MFDSRLRPGRPRKAPPSARVRPVSSDIERTTAAGMLSFAAAVAMLLIYSQFWLMAVAGETADVTESGLIRAMFFPAYALGLLLLLLAPGRFARALIRQPLLGLLMIIAAASWFWSVSPDQTFRRVVALWFTTLGGVALVAGRRWSAIAERLAAAFALLAVACLLAGLFDPPFGRMQTLFPGAWRGVWIEKNTLGSNMTIGAMTCAAAAVLQPRRALLWWPCVALCLLLVLLSTSRTSLVACALGGCGLGLVWIVQRGPVGRTIGTWGAVVAAIAAGMVLLVGSDVVLAALGKDATLTGRTKIWAAVMGQIQERPWLGYGYGAVWSDPSPWTPLARIVREAGFRPAHAHNSWLEPWLGLGVLGLGAWALYFTETAARALVALYRRPGAYLAIPLLLVYAMTSLTESIALVFNDLRWLIFVAIAVRLASPDEAESFPPRTNLPASGIRV